MSPNDWDAGAMPVYLVPITARQCDVFRKAIQDRRDLGYTTSIEPYVSMEVVVDYWDSEDRAEK